jgi:hypothetical protein
VFFVLTESQISQLEVANPFLGRDWFIFADNEVRSQVGLSTDEIFSKLLEFTNTSLGVLQYLLEEPDEVLLQMYPFKSGAIAPLPNVSTLLEKADSSSKVVAGVTVTNYLGAPQGIALYHVVDGVPSTPFDADAIIFIPSPGIPVGTTPIKLNFALRPGDELRALSTGGSCNFVAYITV